jgi:hypothetical protein
MAQSPPICYECNHKQNIYVSPAARNGKLIYLVTGAWKNK